MPLDPGLRRYNPADVAGFCKTADAHGGFSNMASGYPIMIGDVKVLSSEAFYQAMRFPDNQAAQEAILAERSPMMAKRTAYTFMTDTRPDWHEVNVGIMRHALRLKLCMNREKMMALYAEAAGRPIVEISQRDPWWGAKPVAGGMLEGCNVLGRLIMEQRQSLERDPGFCLSGVDAPGIENYRLLGREIGYVTAPEHPVEPYQPSLSI